MEKVSTELFELGVHEGFFFFFLHFIVYWGRLYVGLYMLGNKLLGTLPPPRPLRLPVHH